MATKAKVMERYKDAVKRKCSYIAIARIRTGDGMDETAVAELTHLEWRIVFLMGGISCYRAGRLRIACYP
ncbi:unnamed protein product [Leptidea sinapis]|uniref:Uncharacterized protein n=2 Tax=Leptidea sinapis TaxID=189913 RepID=A0A5E4Q5D6_9NEOP|nr:unnamed protein product [Leptidea sinapis]